jgi:hypothetical protein
MMSIRARALVAALLVATAADAQQLSFSGNIGFTSTGNTAVLRADRIDFSCPAGVTGTSGSMRLELWATTSPFACSGSISGYRTALYQLPQVLSCNTAYTNVSSGTVPFTAPPAGANNYTMLLSEFSNGNYFWEDCLNLSGGGGGSNNGNLVNVTCQNSTITIKFWDFATQDGDIVNITLNGSPLVSNFNLNQCGGPSEPASGTCVVTRSLPPNSANALRVTALNEGSISPNTASLKVSGGCVPEQQEWNLLTGESAQITITTGSGGGGGSVTVPGAPTGVVATALNGAATVSFSPPASNGGASISAYVVTASPGGAAQLFGGTTGTFTGLANGVTYTFTVRARNSAGDGPSSAPSNPVTPGGSGGGGGGTGAASSPVYDLNGDRRTDLVWYNQFTGQTWYQLRAGTGVLGDGSFLIHPTWRVVASGDLDGDGRGDLLWYNSASGDNYYWLMNGTSIRQQGSLFAHPTWRITHTGDFDGDGRSDLLWLNGATGETHIWLMNGANRFAAATILTHPSWRVAETADLNGDDRDDLVWINEATGETYYWLMSGMSPFAQGTLLRHPTWRVVATGDIDGDRRDDLLWYNLATGENYYWRMSGATPVQQGLLFQHPSWRITGTADVDGDGRSDLVWYDPSSGGSVLWFMNGPSVREQSQISTDFRWRVVN